MNAAACIRCRQENGLATLTLANPGKLNAITLAMWRDLACQMRALSADATVRCVIIEGEGEHFAAGGDLEEFQRERATLAQALVYHEEVADALAAIRHCEHPTLAAIRGHCIGGGLEIAAACDIRVCDTTARFGAPINKLGFSMYPGEMLGLLRTCGEATVAEMLLEARILNAAEAVAKQIVSRVVAPQELAGEIESAARRILAGAPKVATWHKFWMRRLAHDNPLTAEEKHAAFAFLETKDYREGIAAFLEKRKPRFTGH
ncbi:MAG: enoyl-CoA hydratase/isomerase family protein [Betaproteobacteria bacterium]|nr:enoyl-CoA hydratase/isomerase family protein [Betaproteobacteria bacterium]